MQAWFDWRRFKVPPLPGPTRHWPADFLDEFRLIDDALRSTNSVDEALDELEDEQ